MTSASNVDELVAKIIASDAANSEKLDLVETVKANAARESFREYRRYIHPKNNPGWFQDDVSKQLQQFYDDLIKGQRPKLVIEAPPQHGKSAMVIDFIAWLSGKAPDNRTIYTSFSERLGIRANLALQRIWGGRQA